MKRSQSDWSALTPHHQAHVGARLARRPHRSSRDGFWLLTREFVKGKLSLCSHHLVCRCTEAEVSAEVSPIRKFVSNDRKFRPFRPLKRSKLYSIDRSNGRNFRSFETNFLIGETSGHILPGSQPQVDSDSHSREPYAL